MLKPLKYFILFFIIYSSSAQVNLEFELNIHKYHKGTVTDVIINEELNEIISADSYGNILVYDALNYAYIRSLNTNKIKSISNIRLINNNKDLLINYYNRYTKKGELYFYNFNKDIIYKTLSGNYKITNPNGEAAIIIARNDISLILYNKSPFEKIDSITTTKPILNATISFNKKYIAVLEQVHKNPGPKAINDSLEIKTLNFYDLEFKKKVHNIKFSDKTKMPSAIVFEKESLFLLTSDQQRNSSEFNRIYLKDYKVQKIGTNTFYTSFANTKIISNTRNNVLIFSDKESGGLGANSCMDLTLQDNLYTVKNIPLKFRTSIGIHNKLNKEYVFLNGQNFRNTKAEINVLDLAYNVLEKNLFIKDYVKSKSLFIANDDWISFNTSESTNKVFNLYKKGDLSNSFIKKDKQSNSFFKTSGRNFRLNYEAFNENLLDKEKSSIGYTSIDSVSQESFFYSYNLLNHKKKKISKKNKGDNPLAFNANVNAFIVEYNKEGDYVYKPNSKLKVLNEDNSIDIDTTFSQFDKIKFSNSGKYLCLIKNKSIKIIDWKNNKQLLTHNFTSYYNKNIFQIDTNNFIASGTNEDTESNVSFMITEVNGAFKITELKGGLVLSADYKNNQLAILLENDLVFNGNNYKINSLDGFATSISLNSDASKMFVNFSNGKTRLLETKTFNWLNTIINFSDDKSLIFNTKGKYYSNFEDVSDYLFLTKNKKRYSLSEYGSSLYDPISILSDFGVIESKLKSKIEEALTIRKNLKKELVNKKSLIKDFYIADHKTSLKTNTLKPKIHIELTQELQDDFVLKINNVIQHKLSFKKIAPKIYETEINLSQKINVVEISYLNNKEKSAPIVKEIIYEYVIPRNLYVLSIGVSNYKDKNYKLNYAHKDALDLSLRYGDVGEESITNYLNTIYPSAIIKSDDNSKMDTILGNINTVFNFFERGYPYTFQLSKNGNFWGEAVFGVNDENDKVKAIKVYNFENNSVHKVYLKKGVSLHMEIPTFQSHANNLGFYYSARNYNENEESIYEVYFYNYKTKETIKTTIPFNIELAYPINDDDWLTTNDSYYDFSNSEDDEETRLCLSINTKKNKVWSKKKYVLDIELSDLVSILDVNNDGSLVLIKHYIDSELKYSLFKLINGKYAATMIDFETDIEEGFISKDNTNVLAFNKYDEYLNVISYYIPNNKITHKKTKISNFNDLQLVGNNYGDPIVLKPSTKENIDLFYEKHQSINQFLNSLKAKPFSYKKTFVKTLTNKEASSKNIVEVANSFFKNARAEDQVILFLAGHGVLNKKLDYYYAPQDMDFNKPDKKGISYRTLVNILSDSPAIQKLLITDTCHSGNTFDLVKNDSKKQKLVSGQRGTITANNTNATDIKTSAVIASIFDNFYSKNGITVLSASSGQEVAYESNNIYNGAFTSAYLKALDSHINKQTIQNFDLTYSNDKDNHFDFISRNLETLLLDITKGKQKMDMREINKLAKSIIW